TLSNDKRALDKCPLTKSWTLCRVPTMGKEIQITTHVLKVLSTFLSDPKAELSGAEVSKRTGLKSGTLYPILIRLESAKWLTSEWEAGDPKILGRPRRRFYSI